MVTLAQLRHHRREIAAEHRIAVKTDAPNLDTVSEILNNIDRTIAEEETRIIREMSGIC